MRLVAAVAAGLLLLGATGTAVEGSPGRPTFRVSSRAEAEARFKHEQRRFEEGKSPTVTVDWLYQPFYLPTGHTAMRVGNQVVEFGPTGWHLHEGNKRNAVSFLFHNQFSRKQVRTFGEGRVPPFTLGLPLELPRPVVERALVAIREDARLDPDFLLLVRNCNLHLLSFLPELRPRGVAAMAASLTFNRLLTKPPFPAGQPTIYPVRELGWSEAELNARVPAYVYRPHSIGRELFRIAREAPTSLRTPWIRKYGKLEVQRLFGLDTSVTRKKALREEEQPEPAPGGTP